jgi:4-amino-4-deoxy-L-arabinose transferase-like glycosyltransferase
VEAAQLGAPRALTAVRARPLAAAAPLALITAVGALLRLWDFGKVGPNPFYDAAVRSMTLSWPNFFFGAYEPGGQVSIDKAPADLWLQVASVKLFGFSSVATRVPEVTAGILAIPLLYAFVLRIFGPAAGLAAAASLAVLPTAILTAHTDTMDSLMMLLDVLAAWLVVVGAQQRRAVAFVGAGAVLGLAFNVKLFEALIALPAIGLLMLLVPGLPARRRAGAIAGAAVAFVAVSLSWIAIASMTGLGARPWPIGSTNGSIWNVVFVFNGTARLTGAATARALTQDPPGLLRFFHEGHQHYLTSVGTMLLAAVVLGSAATSLALARRRFDRLQLAGAVCLGVWLVLGVALLSHVQRLQPRYLEAVTPAIAAVTGIAVSSLASVVRSRHASPLAVAGMVAVLAVPAVSAVKVARAHRSDAGAPILTTPARLTALSRFLAEHRPRGRYELASTSTFAAAPLIIRDARPVLMLTSLYGRPLLTGAQLQHLVARGQVRYLLGRPACGASACVDVMRWARAHTRDVSALAGQPGGTLYRLSAR